MTCDKDQPWAAHGGSQQRHQESLQVACQQRIESNGGGEESRLVCLWYFNATLQVAHADDASG